MEQEDRIDIYTIPPNFAEEGTLLSGRIKTRNAVETGVILGCTAGICIVFAVLYSICYKRTSATYYRIVKKMG